MDNIKDLIKKAVSGDNQSQYELSQLFSEGKSNNISCKNSKKIGITDEIEKNEVQSFHWLYLAAKNGHQQAMLDIASYYNIKYRESCVFYRFSDITGISQYYDSQTTYWLKKAADLGDVKIQYEYARLININGAFDESFAIFKLAASKGYLPAINDLGNCYYFGKGVEKDYKRAVELFEEASNGGLKDATGNLAMCYMKGTGVEVNKEKMKELFELAKTQKSFERIII